MKNVVYFTSAQDINFFKNSLSKFVSVPNLSNQNFHNKLIRTLAISNKVDVISNRPISVYEENKLNAHITNENNITWHYVKTSKSKLFRLVHVPIETYKIVKEVVTKDTVFVVDTLNVFLLSLATFLAKIFKVKIVGICTDDPSNISFVPNNYSKKVLSKSKNLDSFLTLTQKLNELFNPNNKKSLIIDGLTEEFVFGSREIKDEYIYFGGSLMSEYGINNLIEAFNSLKIKDLKLVISGHHEPDTFKNLLNKNIIYLNAVDYDRNLSLEHHALCCVNPRPISKEIDEYSFPSKVLEYLNSGSVTISTMNPLLTSNYNNCVIWSNSASSEDLANAIRKALSLSPSERQQLVQESKKAVLNRTALANINKLIDKELL